MCSCYYIPRLTDSGFFSQKTRKYLLLLCRQNSFKTKFGVLEDESDQNINAF